MSSGKRFRMYFNQFRMFLRKGAEVFEKDAMVIQKRLHPLNVTEPAKCSAKQDAIKSGQHTGDGIFVPINEMTTK